MSKVHFITFSDGSRAFRAAGRRLARQADKSGLFSGAAQCWTSEKIKLIAPEFFISHSDFLDTNPKGMGNYLWKPAVLHEALNSTELGDVLVMLDSGCQFNINEKSIQRFYEYVDLARKHQALFMQILDNSFGFSDLSDAAWTKSFTLNALDQTSSNRKSNQIQSGIIFIVNSVETRLFVQEWYKNCYYEEYSLLTSPLSIESESSAFRGHRWEQSILSLMVKNSNFKYIPDETYWYPDWNKGRDFPIWAMRNRTGGDAVRRNLYDKALILSARIENLLGR